MKSFPAALLLLAAAAALLPGAAALSWPLCNEGGQVWVTERPRTEPTFPGANLWYFCEGGLNVLGVSIDPCINNGTVCSDAVPNALCQGFGFDQAFVEDVKTVPAGRAEPVRSLTGEYCLRVGQYAAAVPDKLSELPGEPCNKIDGLTCVRNRETIITALDAANLAAFRPAPPAAEPVAAACPKVTPEDQQKLAEESATATGSNSGTGGGSQPQVTSQAGQGGDRKLLLCPDPVGCNH